MPMSETIIINARKADGHIHRTWKAALLEETFDYWLFVGEFSEAVNHKQIGLIRQGTISYEYYWKNRWYSVFRFHEPEGDLRNYYCNINQFPSFANNVLDYVDLDIDLFVNKDLSYEVLDLDEFETNSNRFHYSEDVKLNVRTSLKEIIHLIENKLFPFNIA